eukprot:4509083-Prymnesium_polylepis.2
MLAGGRATCAMHTPLSSHVQPALATQALAHAAADAGCNVVEAASVTSITSLAATAADGARFVVCTGDGRRYPARHVVVAAGAWCNEVTRTLGLSVPVSPVKGVIWTT